MAASTGNLISAFAASTGGLAFAALGGTRAGYAQSLRQRVASPHLISQDVASLCGPAAFMFCLATKHPDVYVRYAIDLAEKGKAKIGKLEVAPSSDCRATVLGGSTLDAVDWVTLAGLRDARNLLLDYQSPDDRAAGITMPSTLAGWFRDSELFKDVIDNTNLVFDKDLSDLVQANARRDSGYSVCLFIGAQILYSKPDGGKSIPNHWIVLNKQVLVGGATTIGLSSLGSKVDDDDSLQGKAVSVEAYTWGQEHRALCGGAKSVTVEEFLDYFYGYVCAK